MEHRRILGIDLGIATSHTVVVADETANILLRRRGSPNVESLTKIEQAAQQDFDGPLALPDAAHASLDRRVRAADQLGEVIARHKVRIRELTRQVMPMLDAAIKHEMSYADLLILETAADPHELVDVDAAELGKRFRTVSNGFERFRTVSNGTKGVEHVELWKAVARQAVELYGNTESVAFADISEESAVRFVYRK
jgi:hypothetical protein